MFDKNVAKVVSRKTNFVSNTYNGMFCFYNIFKQYNNINYNILQLKNTISFNDMPWLYRDDFDAGNILYLYYYFLYCQSYQMLTIFN
jgi:hypothetical protein